MTTKRGTLAATMVLAVAATGGVAAMASAQPTGMTNPVCSGTCTSQDTEDTVMGGKWGGLGNSLRQGNSATGNGSSTSGQGQGRGNRPGQGQGPGNGPGQGQGLGNGHGAGGGAAGGSTGGQGLGGSHGSQSLPPAVPDATISAEVEAELLFLAEEEKLAGDVYDLAAAHQDLDAFTNIGQAEDRHLDSVQILLERYGLDDPTEGAAAGQFTDPTLQDLYDRLAAQVVTDQASAVAAGVLIEQTDIADFQELLANGGLPADVTAVAEDLLAGSQRHLAAFQRQS